MTNKYVANTDIDSGYSYIIGPDNFEAWFQLPTQYDDWLEESRGVIDHLNKQHNENRIMRDTLNRITSHLEYGAGPILTHLKAIINNMETKLEGISK